MSDFFQNVDNSTNILWENNPLLCWPYFQRSGHSITTGNIHGEQGRSFVYDFNSQFWIDNATGEKGKGPINLIVARDGISPKMAREKLISEFGIDRSEGTVAKSQLLLRKSDPVSDFRAMTPPTGSSPFVPDIIKLRPDYQKYKLAMLTPYYDPALNWAIAFVIARFEELDPPKDITNVKSNKTFRVFSYGELCGAIG